MTDKNLVQVTLDHDSDREVVMARADTKMTNLMGEKPSSRWSPEYWHPAFDKVFITLSQSTFMLKELGNFIPEGTTGITYGQVGSRNFDPNGTVQYLQVINITSTGVDVLARNDKILKDSPNDPPRSRPEREDILFVNQGVGSLGKTTVFLLGGEYNVSQHIDRIHVKNISPFYICIFMQTGFGIAQIERFNSGVSGQINISFDQIKSIKIPLLSEKNQKTIEKEYKKMFESHNEAMKARKDGDDAGYNKNLKVAKELLKDLVERTEAVIKGEKEDI